MNMVENLLWQKYRPKTLDDIILLPRIREVVVKSTNKNLILHGHYGTGKSTLARIITLNKPTFYRNTSQHTSVDTLRIDIQKFVDTIADIFNKEDSFKYVYLDEFEKASSAYQDALKAFMEDYSDRVRFIFVTNHIHKVEKGVISRSTCLDFNPNTDDEVKWWKSECKKRLIDISNKENIDIEETDIKRIVNHNFPDLRQMIEVLDNVRLTKRVDYSITTFDTQMKSLLYNTVSTGSIVDQQKFVMDNFGPEKVQELFNMCGRPLLEQIITKRPDLLKTDYLGDIYSLVSEHSMWLNTIKGGDPVVVATSCLSNIHKILKNGQN